MRTCYVYGVDGARLKLVENLAPTQDCTSIPASAPATVYFGAVEIRNWQIAGQEQVITYPHPAVRLVNGSTITAASYLHRDALGSVRAITDAAGDKVESAVYKPFGEQTEWLSPAAPAPEAKGWIGERYDASAGLQYLNARYYDPELGMFIQPDWFEVTEPGVGRNRYSYSFNDPVNGRDPGGNGIFGDFLRELSERAVRLAVKSARERAVSDAWKMERQMVKETGAGTLDWTSDQMDELLRSGRVRGFEGHHINTVNGNLDLAANHRNIEFLPKVGHAARHAENGGTQVPIGGQPLIDRTLGGALPDLASEGARNWPNRLQGIAIGGLGLAADVFDSADPWENTAKQSGYRDSIEMFLNPPWRQRGRQLLVCRANPNWCI